MSDGVLFALGGVIMIFAIAGAVLYGALRFNTWVETSEARLEDEAAVSSGPPKL